MKIRKSQPKLAHISAIPCDICLIVHGTVLLHAQRQDLVAQPDESLLRLTPAELAEAARRLLPNTDKQQHIALGLPSGEFVATMVQFPGVEVQNLKSAVSLQLPTLLPGVNETLLLAISARMKGEQTVAIWMSSQRADELFKAFNKVGLFLAAILPRPLIVLPSTPTPCHIYDEDHNSITCIEWSGTTLRQWLYISKADDEIAEFRHQLDQALTHWQTPSPVFPLSGGAEILQIRKTQVADWEDIPMPSRLACSYAFMPPGAIARIAQANSRKKRRNWIVLATLILLVLIGGVGAGYYHLKDREQQLAVLKGGTLDVSKLQTEVFMMENTIAPIKEFPRQNVTEILNKLDQLIPKDDLRRSWISSFRIEAGNVEIEGYSFNPANLLEILSTEPSFVEVAFGRPTRSEPNRKEESFGIKFKIAGIDLQGYWEKYFRETR
ncbi:MAG: hypothetical protein BWK79_13130 [Beggiatoa sp. IS2]|nr:MAG: hypothetical protein BWK79_13130 [Beggiatoa sp. IS2]